MIIKGYNQLPDKYQGIVPSEKVDGRPDPASLNLTGKKKELFETAQQFQSMFIKMMLSNMRKTLNKENDMLHGGTTQEIFEDMLYEERAKDMSKSSAFPIAKDIYYQMEHLVEQNPEALEKLGAKAREAYSENQSQNDYHGKISTGQLKKLLD